MPGFQWIGTRLSLASETRTSVCLYVRVRVLSRPAQSGCYTAAPRSAASRCMTPRRRLHKVDAVDAAVRAGEVGVGLEGSWPSLKEPLDF